MEPAEEDPLWTDLGGSLVAKSLAFRDELNKLDPRDPHYGAYCGAMILVDNELREFRTRRRIDEISRQAREQP